jgi:hypothetical protein
VGGARELLDNVADIAKILDDQNARNAAGACSENEVASIPIDVLTVLPSVYALAQHEGDHRRKADQADHDHGNKQHAYHPTAQPLKPSQDTQNARVSRRPAAVDHRRPRAGTFAPGPSQAVLLAARLPDRFDSRTDRPSISGHCCGLLTSAPTALRIDQRTLI